MKTALLYFNRLLTGNQLNSWNIFDGGVVKSAQNIIRAVRFCAFLEFRYPVKVCF